MTRRRFTLTWFEQVFHTSDDHSVEPTKAIAAKVYVSLRVGGYPILFLVNAALMED